MTDTKKTDSPVKGEKADKTPKVVSEHKVGEDTYYVGEDGSRWVVRGDK